MHDTDFGDFSDEPGIPLNDFIFLYSPRDDWTKEEWRRLAEILEARNRRLESKNRDLREETQILWYRLEKMLPGKRGRRPKKKPDSPTTLSSLLLGFKSKQRGRPVNRSNKAEVDHVTKLVKEQIKSGGATQAQTIRNYVNQIMQNKNSSTRNKKIGHLKRRVSERIKADKRWSGNSN